jgi:hypothetical protein
LTAVWLTVLPGLIRVLDPVWLPRLDSDKHSTQSNGPPHGIQNDAITARIVKHAALCCDAFIMSVARDEPDTAFSAIEAALARAALATAVRLFTSSTLDFTRAASPSSPGRTVDATDLAGFRLRAVCTVRTDSTDTSGHCTTRITAGVFLVRLLACCAVSTLSGRGVCRTDAWLAVRSIDVRTSACAARKARYLIRIYDVRGGAFPFLITGNQTCVAFGQIPGPSSSLFWRVLLLRFCVIIIFCALN